MSCFFGHNWEKWEQYRWQGRVSYPSERDKWYEVVENRQKRKCKTCGHMQDQEIKAW